MILHLHAELDLAPQHGLGLDKYEAHEEGEERAGHHQGGAQDQHLKVPVTEHVSHNLQERGKMIKSLIMRNNTIDYLLLGLAAVTVQQRDGYKFHGEYGRTWPPPSSCPCSRRSPPAPRFRYARVLIYDILNINSYMMGGHKSESFYAAMLCKWFVVLQTLGLYKVKFIIKFQSCEES